MRMPKRAMRCCCARRASNVISPSPNSNRAHSSPICCRKRRSSSVRVLASRRWHSFTFPGSDSSIVLARFCANMGRAAAQTADLMNWRRWQSIALQYARAVADRKACLPELRAPDLLQRGLKLCGQRLGLLGLRNLLEGFESLLAHYLEAFRQVQFVGTEQFGSFL